MSSMIPTLRQLLALSFTALIVLSGCSGSATPGADLPTNTLAPLVTLTPRFTATPQATRTPPPTSTFTPSVTPIPPTLTNTFTPTVPPPVIGIITSLNTVNVRRGPAASFPAFVALTPGTGVEVLGQNPEGTWLNIKMDDGQEGWVFRELVRIESQVPIPTFTPSADGTAVAQGTTLPTAVVGGALVSATPQAATPTLAATLTPSVTANLPVIDLTAINLTATALAFGRPTSAASPTPPSAQNTPQPVGTGTASPAAVTNTVSAPTVTPAPGTATVQQGVDVLAYCDNPLYGVRAPQNLAAGSTLDVWWGWYAKTEDQVRQHVAAAVYEVRVNGVLLENWRQFARPIRLEGDGNYHIYWFVPSAALPAGQTVITYKVSWTQAITDGYASFGPGTGIPTQEGSCTFTVR